MVERSFSHRKLAHNPLRNRLCDASVEALMFVRMIASLVVPCSTNCEELWPFNRNAWEPGHWPSAISVFGINRLTNQDSPVTRGQPTIGHFHA